MKRISLILIASAVLSSCGISKYRKSNYEAWRACIEAADGTDTQCRECNVKYGQFKLKHTPNRKGD